MSPGAAADRGESPGNARAYHDATKHSRASVRTDRHTLDWANKPFPFKVYPDAPAVPLPREVSPPALPALEAVARGVAAPGEGRVDLTALAQLLFFSAGLTKRKVYPGGEATHFRAAASTGALYQTEVYVVAGAVDGLEPSVYHFCPGDFTLRRLRAGDHRAALAEATGRGELVADAPATVILTAIHWRNTWKYQARAFRHFFWDAGTLLANLLATAVALDVPARVLLGYADAPVNALLGIDAAREGALTLVPLGRGAGPAPPSPPAPPLSLSSVPLSPREMEYPLIHDAYVASSLPGGAAARAWLAGAGDPAAAPAAPPREPSRPLGETILRRGSTREFGRDAIPAAKLTAILDAALRPLPLDLDEGEALVETYLLVHAADGLTPGAYVWDRATRWAAPPESRASSGRRAAISASSSRSEPTPARLRSSCPTSPRSSRDGEAAATGPSTSPPGFWAVGSTSARTASASARRGSPSTMTRPCSSSSRDAAGKDAIFVTALGGTTRRPAGGGLPVAPALLEPLRPGDA